MISFRYHVVSLVAVLLALAAGIVLGSGPLQRADERGSTTGDPGEVSAAAASRIAGLQEDLTFADAYAEATAGGLVASGLKGRAVTLLSLPGADPDTVGRLADLVSQAGGAVTARLDVEEKLMDVANRQLVDELGSQMQDAARKKVTVPRDASAYEQIGRLLAHAVATTRNPGQDVDGVGEDVLAGLSTADLVAPADTVDQRGSLVLVVAGAPYGSADQRSGAGSILTSLVTALDAGSDGVVVAGPVAAGGVDGLIAAVRSDPKAATKVSTVDVAGRVAGDVVAVLALRGETAGRAGHFGSAASADGPVPGLAGTGSGTVPGGGD